MIIWVFLNFRRHEDVPDSHVPQQRLHNSLPIAGDQHCAREGPEGHHPCTGPAERSSHLSPAPHLRPRSLSRQQPQAICHLSTLWRWAQDLHW